MIPKKRGAGGIELLTRLLAPVMNLVHFPAELLPMAVVRPLSGSGALGVFSELVHQYGPDHLLSRTAAVIYGSTETTFYVLAVYFGSVNIKAAFFLVRFLEDVGYTGSRHFDAHAYRQSDLQDVKAFARGSMRTYMILKEKSAIWNADKRIQSLLKEINVQDAPLSKLTKRFSAANATKLLAANLDRIELAKARLPYEELDQLTMEILMGVA